MSKTIKFNLILDGKPVSDIEGLQENFNIDDVLKLYRNGLLQKWLKVREYKDYLKKVDLISDKQSTIIELVKIFELKKSEKEIKEAIYSLEFWEERKMELSKWNQMDYKVKEIISHYHNSYNDFKARIHQNIEDMPYMKSAAKEIFDKYLEIFKIDYKYFFNEYKESSPLIIYAILMNDNLRSLLLDEQELKKFLDEVYVIKNMTMAEKLIYSKFSDYLRDDESESNGSDNSSELQKKIDLQSSSQKTASFFDKMIESNSDTINEKSKIEIANIIDNKIKLNAFSGVTDGYWKDLEVSKTKVMVLSIPEGTFIRSVGKPKEELSTRDVNGNFLILDGLLYKSNDSKNSIVYMEV